MANIRVDVSGIITDGQSITFKAPCDCSEIEKLNVYYIENGVRVSKLFTMKDAHGNDLTSIGNLFEKDAYVVTILNSVDGVAYLQNADTNAYLEGRFENLEIDVVDNLESTATNIPLSANQGRVLKNMLGTQATWKLSGTTLTITTK